MDLVGRRCDHLMKAAEKEVEHLEKKAREEAGLPSEAEEGSALPPVELSSFKEMQRKMRRQKRLESEKEKQQLEQNVEEIESKMKEIQDRLKELSKDPSEEQKENVSRNGAVSKKRKSEEEERPIAQEEVDETRGAIGPDGDFVEFPEYDASQPPKEAKKAFTHFCVSTRKEVKASLDEERRRKKDVVNGILRDRWLALSDEEKETWRRWAAWDKKRYARDLALHEQGQKSRGDKRVPTADEDTMKAIHIPKKRASVDQGDGGSTFAHIPKKKRR